MLHYTPKASMGCPANLLGCACPGDRGLTCSNQPVLLLRSSLHTPSSHRPLVCAGSLAPGRLWLVFFHCPLFKLSTSSGLSSQKARLLTWFPDPLALLTSLPGTELVMECGYQCGGLPAPRGSLSVAATMDKTLWRCQETKRTHPADHIT